MCDFEAGRLQMSWAVASRGEVRLTNLGTPPLDVDEHGAVEGLVSFDAAEVDQPHLVVKVRFLQHALLSEVPGTVGDGI